MDKLNSTKFKENLLKVVRMDYHIQVYNYSDDFFTISFNHLNSVYNGLATININTGKTIIDYQYHTKNKQIEKIIISILEYIRVQKRLRKNYDWIIDTIDYYSELSKTIFKAKYSTSIILHTEY